MGLHAGDISATAAWDLLSREADSMLVDVRTPEEWDNIGVADLSALKKQPLFLSWRHGAEYKVNESFLLELQAVNSDKNRKIFFMCKGGGRSHEAAAAATAAGYKYAFNLANGFEAETGWKSAGLPCRKSEVRAG